MFRIGEFSKLSKVTVKALRYYDEVGLLKPEHVDPVTSYRFYTTKQLVKLHEIQSLRQIGLSIDEVKLVQSGQNTQDVLLKRRAELISSIQREQDQLSRVDFLLSKKGEMIFMDYNVTVKELPGCIVYSKKLKVSSYDSYFQLIPEIGKSVVEKYPDLKCSVPEYCFIIYLDGEYRESDINIEFCEAVDKAKPDFDDIVFKEIESVVAASVMHRGPYRDIARAYAYLSKWIEENGYIAFGNPRESYIDGIWNKDREEDWLTELQIPIEKKRQ